MRATPAEKLETIRLVDGSDLSVRRSLEELQVPRSTFYRWYRAYEEDGYAGLEEKPPVRRRFWNRIPESERERVVEAALTWPELSPRELAWRIDQPPVFVPKFMLETGLTDSYPAPVGQTGASQHSRFRSRSTFH